MDVRQWVETWERAGRELELQRREQLRSIDTAEAIRSLSLAYRWAAKTLPPRPSSGLVEQQAIFSRLRPKP